MSWNMLAATQAHGKMDTMYYDTSFLIYNRFNRTGTKIRISNIQVTESNRVVKTHSCCS